MQKYQSILYLTAMFFPSINSTCDKNFAIVTCPNFIYTTELKIIKIKNSIFKDLGVFLEMWVKWAHVTLCWTEWSQVIRSSISHFVELGQWVILSSLTVTFHYPAHAIITRDSPLQSGNKWGGEKRTYTLRPRQDGRQFPDHFIKCIFLNENVWISIRISLKFVPRGPINNIPSLVQIMAWHRPGDKPLSEPMMVSLLMHICVTWPHGLNELTHRGFTMLLYSIIDPGKHWLR